MALGSAGPASAHRRVRNVLGHLAAQPTSAAEPEELAEYSVVYTDRSLNHMGPKFKKVMCDVSRTLKSTYNAEAAVIIPGSGSYGMEAVARAFGMGEKCIVIRNGYFSFRWSQIFEVAQPSKEIVLCARPIEEGPSPQYAPPPLAEVQATIREERPAAVFAPNVETSAGMILPDDYIRGVAEATHEVGGFFILDCIASGCIWIDMQALGVDVVISAPQKSWSGPACAGLVMLSQAAKERVTKSKSTSFCVDLRKWLEIMAAYEAGGQAYHTTMPTDAIASLRDTQREMIDYGLERLRQDQFTLGNSMRSMLSKHGYKSVAAEGFGAPGVVVSYTSDEGVKSGTKFTAQGVQISPGVPLMLDDFTKSPAYSSFRLGLFGVVKLSNIERTVDVLEKHLIALA
eukprot:TRINITY_DN9315_c0_g1_i1.p1 TRINITY_DN9315_c0_g1~~TRINITY_DN9315_c0_g1_i1.p1  ORF type:complete len:420 (+),score=76.41 TRINITY_DN9315_c0_g1_i1:61-1260(+)